MKPASFDYVRPGTLSEAIGALSELEWGARIIAGGQSLVPMMNLRLTPVMRLVDVSRLDELRVADDRGDRNTLGAALRHADFEDGKVPDGSNGLMRSVAGRIAYRAIRNRGTIGGSVSLADPSADWITVLMALGATFNIAGPGGERRVKAGDMFRGAYTTALEDHDILVSIEVPKLSRGAQTGNYKITRKAGEYPMTTATVVRDREKGLCNVVLGASVLTQRRLPRTSDCVGALTDCSERSAASIRSAYRKDMSELGQAGDSYVLKICETTVVRAVRVALEG